MVKLPSLSIIIPAFNEEGSLEAVVRGCEQVRHRIAENSEIIVVNDGSTDATGEIANRLAGVRVVHHPVNCGFGAAFRSGIDASRMEFISLIPADGQFDADHLQRLIAIIDDCDIAVGYRTNRPDPLVRKLNTLLLRMVMHLVFGIRLRDINWVKLYRRAVFDRIQPASNGIGIDAEIITRAKAAGFRFRETLVGYNPRTTGVATGGQWKNVKRTLLELWKLALSRNG